VGAILSCEISWHVLNKGKQVEDNGLKKKKIGNLIIKLNFQQITGTM